MDPTRHKQLAAADLAPHKLAQRYYSIRGVTRALARPLSAEDCALQSMPDASPVKWHLAHTTWFFETFILEPGVRGYRVFDPAFRMLFNSYYNAIGARHPRPERGMLSRPSLQEVIGYREHVDQALLSLIEKGCEERLAGLVELGLNHEQQHQELILTDVKHLLSRNPLKPVYQKQWPLTAIRACEPRWIRFGGGLHDIGHAAGADGASFAFDNESPRHQVWLEPFQIASQPVTHGEFIEFVRDGGYRRPELWLSAGWDAVAAQGWQAPGYWRKSAGDAEDEWHTFTLHGEVPVDPHTPVCHLSFYEADAFARWAGARLPSEAEWEVAASRTLEAGTPLAGNFLDSGALHPLALREAPAEGRLGQAFGDVWEWTRSNYGPYPGFRAAEGAVGEYNGKFMSGQYVLRGGSCVTPASHVRATYRNFFPPEARWQFSGLRLARDL